MLDNLIKDAPKDSIGVVGYSFALSSISLLLHESGREEADFDIIGGVLLDEGGNPLNTGFEFPLYRDVSDMLASHPEISMVFELSGKPGMVRSLRASLPAEVGLVELPAARFFLRLHATDRLWIACKADLMQTQVLFRSVVDQIPEDVVIIGSDGLVMDCNKHFCARVGLAPEALRGSNPLHFYSSLTSVCPAEDGVIKVEAMAGGRRAELMMPETDDEGRMNFYRLYVYPITEEGTEKVVQLVIIRRNITERTLMEQRLQQSERMVMVGELSAYIAHEIRNPLMAMGGFAKVLMDDENIDAEGQEKIRIIYDESCRLDNLLKSILSFVRSRDIEKKNIDINRVAEDAAQLFSLSCKIQNVEVKKDLDPDIPLGVGGEEQVRQCLINLVKNSLEAMPEGGIIQISSGLSGEHVWLEVRDDGPGIRDEIRTQVFDPFYSSKVNGNGLGLSMVKKIMEEFGGAVELASRPDKGTSVALLLPIANTVA